MSGGPQVFLGATTFCLIASPPDLRPPRGHPTGRVRLWPHGCSGRRRARPPARLGGLTSFGAAPRSAPVPSGPTGALHTSGAGARLLEARPGPAGLAAASNRAALGMTRPGPAGLAAASNRAALLMAPRVFRAPEGPAAREARRPHFVRRRASKPARALRTLRRPPHLWGRGISGAVTRQPNA